MRFEDLLADPIGLTMSVWSFLKADANASELDIRIRNEMRSNPDADWQKEKDESLAKWLPKGRAGSGNQFLTASDERIVNEFAGAELVKLGYGGA